MSRPDELHCILPGCGWHTLVPDAPPSAMSGVRISGHPPTDFIDACVAATIRAHAEELEAVVREHLESHTVLEWANGYRRLLDEIEVLKAKIAARVIMVDRPNHV